MNTKLLLNLATAMTLIAGQGAFAAVGKVLVEPFKDIESKHSAIEKVIQQKASFETLKAKQGTEAFELARSIEEVARLHELGSVNDVQAFALRGSKEAKIIRALARAEEVLEAKDREGKVSENDKNEMVQIRAAVKSSSGFVSALGKNPVLGVTGEKSNEALNKLISVLPKMISEYSKEERQGYIKLLNEMTSELNRRDNTELPAEILRKKLGEERMNQLLGCKA
ncbi:MAG: hypothetical protein RJB66_1528 [Pseudomonadota bacterium]|jgi:hypothetical protein